MTRNDPAIDEKALGRKLPGDYDSPFSEPDGQEDRLPADHPQTDSNVEPPELYDEGLAAAAEVDLPEKPAVVGYHPPGQRKKARAERSRRPLRTL